MVSPDGDVAVNENCSGTTDDVPVYQQFTHAGAARFSITGTSAAQPACPTPTVFDARGNSYVAMYSFNPVTDASAASIYSYTPQGTVRWSKPITIDADIHGMALGYDGKLWAIYGVNQVLSLNATTGGNLVAPAFATDQDDTTISAYPSGLVIAGVDLGATGVSYYTYGGVRSRLVRADDAISYPGAVAVGAGGTAYVAGCNATNQAVVMEATPSSGETWLWTQPPSATDQCTNITVAPTPDGGLVVGSLSTVGSNQALTYFDLSNKGALRWTHIPSVPQGVPFDQYSLRQPVVDTNGDVVLPSEYLYSDSTCADSQCALSRVDFVDQTTGVNIFPSLDLPVDSANTFFAVGAGRLYAARGGYLWSGQTLNAYDVPGMSGDYLQSLEPNNAEPTIAEAQILAPSLSDHLLARRVRITPSKVAPVASYQYGWLAPGKSGSAPMLGIQGCANAKGSCTVSFAATNPSQAGWTLYVRAKSTLGITGPWTKAVDTAGRSAITTPSPPILVALGDSITSGHHRLSGYAETTCNDASFGYPEYVWRHLELSVPSQWRASGGYYNFAKSGFSTTKVLKGGKDACGKSFSGSSVPITDAEKVLKSHLNGWARVVITDGIDDTNWGAVIESIYLRSESGTNVFYGASACSQDLANWDFGKANSTLPHDVEGRIKTIAEDIHAASQGSSVELDWLSYYNIAPKQSGHPPIPMACGSAVGKAVTLLNSDIQVGLATVPHTWVNLRTTMDQESGLLQPWLKTDGPGTGLGITLPGWPHPNAKGAAAIAGLVNVVN